jgi:hypothetical protein
MKDSTELYTCSLEMKGGLEAGIDYPQKFVRAPKSQFPGKPIAHPGKEMNANDEAMKISMGR